MPRAVAALAVGGKDCGGVLPVVEDKIVKRELAKGARSTTPAGLPVRTTWARALSSPTYRGAHKASTAEAAVNPRSASVRLRAAERLRNREPVLSAIPATPVRPASPSARRSPEQQVISGLPKLALVPTPAPAKGLSPRSLCAWRSFLGAFATVFYLNTQMVATAYEVQNVNRQINASATNETLTDQVVQVSRPEGLRAKATELGMVPATDTRFLDLDAGDVVIPADPKAVFQAPPLPPSKPIPR